MTSSRKIVVHLVLVTLLLFAIFFSEYVQNETQKIEEKLFTTKVSATNESGKCIQCHFEINPSIVMQWERSKHAQKKVGCYECHVASSTDADSYEHFGVHISSVISPLDCGRCHEEELKSFSNSTHAHAATINKRIRELIDKGYMWKESVDVGCFSCHGQEVTIISDTKKPDFESIINNGIGRINPDGSKGNCNACHYKHEFNIARVINAEPCIKCHSGSTYSQYDVWKSSKHARLYNTSNYLLDLNRKQILGISKISAPNCVTCHLGGSLSPSVKSTHDPSQRLAWKLGYMLASKRESWKINRKRMQEVCRYCHSLYFYSSHFQRFDRFIEAYNKNFIEPAANIIEKLNSFIASFTTNNSSSYSFSEANLSELKSEINLVNLEFFKLWHEHGRKAKLGVAMMSPEYASWQGIFEVNSTYYYKFLSKIKKNFPSIYNEFLKYHNLEK